MTEKRYPIPSTRSTPSRTRKTRGKGEGSVYQRADRTWVGTVELGVDP